MSPAQRPSLLADATGIRDPALGSLSNFAAWNGDPRYIQAGIVATGGTLYVMGVWVDEPTIVQNLWVSVSTAGSTLTAGQNLISLYSTSGVKLADSADQSGIWTSSGSRAAAITPQAITAGSYVYVTLLSVGTTPASFSRLAATPVVANSNTSGATLVYAVNGTGLSATPATITPSANTTAGAQGFWVALS